MKKLIMMAAMVGTLCACGGNGAAKSERCATDSIASSVATTVVPPAATEVLPAAAPSAENGGKVATEVIPNEPAK